MKQMWKKLGYALLVLSLMLVCIPGIAEALPVEMGKLSHRVTKTILIPDPMDPDQQIRTVETLSQQWAYEPLAEVEYLTDYWEAGAILREAMKNREATVDVPFEINFDDSIEDVIGSIMGCAVDHTGNPTEGDYLAKQRGAISIQYSCNPNINEFQYIFTFNLEYYTTAEQEAQVDVAVQELLSSLNLDGMTDYEKVRAVYDWMCANITYDNANLNDDSYNLKYTAYAALIDRTAVCQGYAVLFYRLMLELGIDCRIVTGTGNGGPHAWNIVEVGGLYYNVDATWDASWHQAGLDYNFFLRADATFEDHIRDAEFDNAGFRKEYPMTRADFDPNAACIHNYISVVTNPTCTEQGYTTRTCEYCGDSYSEYYIEAHGHGITDWITTVVPTETTYGHQYRECWYCGLTEEREILLIPELVNTMLFSTDGVAYLHDEYGQVVKTYTGWMTEIYEIEDDYSVSAGGYMTTAPWFFDVFQFSTERVIIEDGVNPVSTDHWFDYWENLTSITFPASITNIGHFIFHACDNLTELWFEGDAPTFDEEAFAEHWERDDPITAYYPAGNATWTEVITQDFGRPITWVPYEKEETIIASGICGDNLTWELTDDGILTISGTGEMYNYTDEALAPWNAYIMEIEELVIADTVANIGDFAFCNCYCLTDVVIPNSVTKIGANAFIWCSALNSVSIGDSVTSIGDNAFYGCEKLAKVTFGNSLVSIGKTAFYQCTSLSSISLPDSLTTVGQGAFFWCFGLTSVSFGDGPAVIEMEAFNGCDSLTNLDLGGVTRIGDYAFSGCWSLIGFTIPDSVTSIGNWAFNNCSNLASITIPDSVTSVGENAFDLCSALVSATIGDGMTSISYGMFSRCSSLTSVTIGNSVTRIGEQAFGECYALTCITIPESVTFIGSFAFNYCTNLWHILYKGTEEQWHNIQIDSYNAPLNQVTRHNECDGTEVTDAANKACKICDCEHTWDEGVVTEAPRCETGGVMTYTCILCGSSRTEEIAPTGHTEEIVYGYPASCTTDGLSDGSYCSVCDMILKFQGVIPATGHDYTEWYVETEPSEETSGQERRDCKRCGHYETNYIPPLEHTHQYEAIVTAPTCTEQGYTTHVCRCGDSYVDSYVDAPGHSFGEWETVTEPTETTEGYESRTCRVCGITEGRTIPVLEPGEYAEGTLVFCADGIAYFYGAGGVVEETYTGWMTERYPYAIIDDSLTATTPWAARANQIVAVVIEDGVAPASTDFWFMYCQSLSSVSIGSGLTTIGEDMFFGYNQLTSITIPDTVTSIGLFAFAGCENLTQVIFEGDAPAIGEYAFHHMKATAYYPAGNDTWTNVVKQSYRGQIVWLAYGEELPPTCENEHTFEMVVMAATCTEDGYTTYTCTGCGGSYVDGYTYAIGHHYEISVTNPTCTESGYTTHTCQNCGATFTDSAVDPVGHDYSDTLTHPTCTEQGYTTHTCSRCSDSYVDSYTEATGHSWNDGEVTKQPTVEEEGIITYTCTVCGATRTESIAQKDTVIYDTPEDDSVQIPNNDCFEGGTTVTVEKVEEGEVFQQVAAAMENRAGSYTVFEFTAIKDGAAVQPNGKLTVTFDIPENYSTNVAVYYMDEAGKLTKLEAVVDQQNRTITVELAHFSIYVLTDEDTAPDFVPGDVNGDGRVTARDVRQVMLYVAKLADASELNVAAADVNGDGRVTARDVRAIMLRIAGLE